MHKRFQDPRWISITDLFFLNSIKNSPITKRDIELTEKMLGPRKYSLQGKRAARTRVCATRNGAFVAGGRVVLRLVHLLPSSSPSPNKRLCFLVVVNILKIYSFKSAALYRRCTP